MRQLTCRRARVDRGQNRVGVVGTQARREDKYFELFPVLRFGWRDSTTANAGRICEIRLVVVAKAGFEKPAPRLQLGLQRSWECNALMALVGSSTRYLTSIFVESSVCKESGAKIKSVAR